MKPDGVERAAPDFLSASSAALRDPELRTNFRRAMDGLMEKRTARFADPVEWREMRDRGAAIRARSLARLPELLEELEARCTENGIQVHWAETVAEANATVLAILEDRGVTRLVKGKSMVSEELHLNAFLEAHGIESLETDLGEYVIQLDGEVPSHIIMPAIHKNRRQIAKLFARKIKDARDTAEVDELTATARSVLRQKFFEAEAGLSGVNFAVAESGTLVLVENEGNGRMSTHVPPVHVAVMGIEKVVETLEDVPVLLRLLTRSATGQAITTYVNFITGPRGPDEKDGPREVHLVILDNGRSRIHSDPELRTTLRCIRCGACMNHCPVYTRVGGHAYESVYPGPIGQILTPQMEGLGARSDLPQASSLCNACVEVCPVGIPIAGLLVRLRAEGTQPAEGSTVAGAGAARNLGEALIWKLWRWIHVSPVLYRVATAVLRRALPVLPRVGPLGAWTASRTRPRAASRGLHAAAARHGVDVG